MTKRKVKKVTKQIIRSRREIMFQDPGFYIAFRDKVVPFLKTYPSVRVWYVGCRTGEELYSVAILLHEEGLDARCRIYATERNGALLKKAERGVFPISSLKRYLSNYRKAGGKGDFREYFTIKKDRAAINEMLRSNISFFQHDLATDGSFNEFQAILCRSEMRHLSAPIKGNCSPNERIHRILFESLCVFGVLGLRSCESGVREIDGADFESHYRSLDIPVRLYKKVA